MSGHSKWHNIRLKKGKMDAERGKIFTKLSREIIMAARAHWFEDEGADEAAEPQTEEAADAESSQ